MPKKNTIKTIFYVLVFIFATDRLFTSFRGSSSFEFDEVTYVTRIIDGDSFEIPGDEVRLADVSAPEWNELGGSEATSALRNLIEGETIYLDTDQKSGRDRYGRLIAVAYILINTDKYQNINKALLLQGVVVETDYLNNEFNPSTWTQYSTGLNDGDTVKFLLISIGFGFAVILALHFILRKLSRILRALK